MAIFFFKSVKQTGCIFVVMIYYAVFGFFLGGFLSGLIIALSIYCIPLCLCEETNTNNVNNINDTFTTPPNESEQEHHLNEKKNLL